MLRDKLKAFIKELKPDVMTSNEHEKDVIWNWEKDGEKHTIHYHVTKKIE